MFWGDGRKLENPEKENLITATSLQSHGFTAVQIREQLRLSLLYVKCVKYKL